jgi:hypothetical protein
MKNITQANTMVKCYNCNMNGFFCYTPNGADFDTCPFCGQNDYLYAGDHDNFEEISNILKKCKIGFSFCSSCRILYHTGCTHAVNGCTDDTYNAHVIKLWKYNGTIYEGMPQFASIDEWLKQIQKIEVLEMICLNNGNHCEKGRYPKSEYPDDYDVCYIDYFNKKIKNNNCND